MYKTFTICSCILLTESCAIPQKVEVERPMAQMAPTHEVVQPIIVQRMCALPPLPNIPSVRSLPADSKRCPQDLVCFDMNNAKRLVIHVGLLRNWAFEAWKRCGPKPPTKQNPIRRSPTDKIGI